MSAVNEVQKGKFVKAKDKDVSFPEEIILQEGSFVKKVAQTTIVQHKTKGRLVESLDIDTYRKARKADPWPDAPETHTLLTRPEIIKLWEYLATHRELKKLGETSNYLLIKVGEDFPDLDVSQQEMLVKLIEQGALKDVLRPEVLGNVSAAVQQSKYKQALEDLGKMLEGSKSEADYRGWFLEHPWIFGTEYEKPEETTRIAWASKGDIILTSIDGYQDIIELKLPSFDVLNYDDSHKSWYPSSDLSKALAQVVKYIQDTEDDRRTLEDEEGLPFLKPRARIVIGRSTGWDGEKLAALRRLNSAFQNIQIMTYDHLIAIGSRMVTYYEEQITTA